MTKTKKELREAMQTKMAALSKEDRHQISQKLHQQLFKTKLWQEAEIIGLYLSFGHEWDTRAIVKKAWENGKKIAIPKTIPTKKEMKFYQIQDFNELEKGHFGIEEPIVEQTTQVPKNDIDLLIVPGLVFSKDGYRVGYGGGYYDRFLVDFIQPTLSLVWSGQLAEELPTNQFDIAVQYLLTENEIMI